MLIGVTMLYPVAILQENNHFIAKIPDLPSLQIQGDSIAQTISNVRQAIIDHLQTLADADLAIPQGQDINTHLLNPDYYGHTWAIISLDSLRLSNQTLPLRLELPKSLIRQIQQTICANQAVSHQDISQSELESFITQAIREKLAK